MTNETQNTAEGDKSELNNLVMRFQHDCYCCVPLGQVGEYDLYYCKQEALGIPTLIARWGDDGPEYKSGMGFVGHDPEITVAFERAKARGLLDA